MSKFVANGNLFDSWTDVVKYSCENKLIIKGMKILNHLNVTRYLVIYE